MNLSRSHCYASVQGEAKVVKLTRSKSPASQSKRTSDGKVSQSHMLKIPMSTMKNAVRSVIPKKFLIHPCLLNSGSKGRRLGYDVYQDDSITPVIFYQDEDAVVKKVELPLVDPFAFAETKNVRTAAKDADVPKEKTPSNKQIKSPTSVFGLFTVEEECSIVEEEEEEEEDSFFFDDNAFFPRSLTRVFDENTSIDTSESILSINAPSVCEDDKVDESATGFPEQWFGFLNSESFTSCEWDPESELADGSFEMVQLE